MIFQDTNFRKALTVEKRVAISLRCLATPCEYRTVAHLFGVARSTVCTIVHSTCQAIVNNLLRKYAKFPTGDKSKWGFPQCVGAIDGSHIPIYVLYCKTI